MNVSWLRGLAGSGKNTVAQTIADRSRLLKLLEAHTFYSWAKSNPGLVLQMLAYQLARHNPIIARYMFDVVKVMDIISVWMEIQALTEVSKDIDSPVVIIQAALDECGKSQDRRGLMHAQEAQRVA